MDIHYLVPGTLEVAGAERAGKSAEHYAARVGYLTAMAVRDGMEGEELHGYIQGLSAMAGECVEKRTRTFTQEVLEWGDAMIETGETLPRPSPPRY